MILYFETVNFSSTENVKELLNLRSGLYKANTTDGEEVFMTVQQERELTIRYFQPDDWRKTQVYNSNGILVEEKVEPVRV